MTTIINTKRSFKKLKILALSIIDKVLLIIELTIVIFLGILALIIGLLCWIGFLPMSVNNKLEQMIKQFGIHALKVNNIFRDKKKSIKYSNILDVDHNTYKQYESFLRGEK